MIAARFRLRGRVQGVAFRACTQRQARALGLRGHAVNRPDGTVELLACGHAGAVDALATWLADGPPLARVEAVERHPADPADAGPEFVTG